MPSPVPWPSWRYRWHEYVSSTSCGRGRCGWSTGPTIPTPSSTAGTTGQRCAARCSIRSAPGATAAGCPGCAIPTPTGPIRDPHRVAAPGAGRRRGRAVPRPRGARRRLRRAGPARRQPGRPGAPGARGASGPGCCRHGERYLRECSPADRAALVVRYDHPERPALGRRAQRQLSPAALIALPYQSSTSRRAMEIPGGSSSSPVATSRASSSRDHQRASASSTPSTWISVLVAVARKPSMSEDGNGQGWLPR